MSAHLPPCTQLSIFVLEQDCCVLIDINQRSPNPLSIHTVVFCMDVSWQNSNMTNCILPSCHLIKMFSAFSNGCGVSSFVSQPNPFYLILGCCFNHGKHGLSSPRLEIEPHAGTGSWRRCTADLWEGGGISEVINIYLCL